MSIYQTIDDKKALIDQKRPFEGELLNQLKQYYKIGLTYSSNALEGNTLTISETKVLLEDGLTVGGKPLRDTFEAIGHAKAYDYMFTLLGNKTIEERDVLTMHRMFYGDIDDENAGAYRTQQVFISGSAYEVTAPGEISAQMDDLFSWIKTDRQNYHPVEFAAELHRRFVFIHPFIDGNGRLARLLMNTALIQDGYMIAVIPPVLRNEYIEKLELAHKDITPFNEFIAERVLESEREVIRLLHIGEE
jgi:Fic family protein